MLGTVVEHVLLVLSGTGANGKSVFYEALIHALGDYGVTLPAGLLDHRKHEQHPSELMALRGARLGILSETDRNVSMNERRMKSLTGGDSIAARKMYGDWVTFHPTWTLAMVTNHPPSVSADDEAVWRRMRRAEFAVTIPEAERNPRLADELRADADAVLSWAVAGLADFQRRGERLAEPAAVLATTASYRGDNDPVARFLDECCQTGPSETTAASELFARWSDWCRDEDTHSGTARSFGADMERRGFLARKGTGGVRLRTGLSLLAEDDHADTVACPFTVISGNDLTGAAEDRAEI